MIARASSVNFLPAAVDVFAEPQCVGHILEVWGFGLMFRTPWPTLSESAPVHGRRVY